MIHLVRSSLISCLVCALVLPASAAAADQPAWVEAMRAVHARSSGERGVLVHLGDSITYSMAYFAPLQYAADAVMPAETRDAWKLVQETIQKDCYRWKGGERGNYSGQTAAWGLKNVDRWIDELKPEVAVIMFGTNDIRRGTVAAHEQNLRGLVRACLDQGVVVILSTIPPMHGFQERVQEAVAVQRKIAQDEKVPLIDFYAHVVNRRPADWDGTLPAFASFGQWDVPTLISKDGVHPSNPQPWRKDYTEEGLCRNGNVLRTYLTLMAYAEVIRVVIHGQPPSKISTTILGANPPKPSDLPDLEAPEPTSQTTTPDGPWIHPPQQAWFPQAPPLPPPAGTVLRVETTQQLFDAAEQVPAGGTIAIADGFYRMPRTLQITTDRVTLRGACGDRTRVVLDFSTSRHHEGIAVSDCSDVTIADLAVQNVRQNGIKLNSNRGVDRVTIHNVISHNVWQRHVKGPRVPDDQDGQPGFVDDCRIQYCLFYNDRPKRRGDEPWEDSNPATKFNYIGGIDVMCARNWVIRENVFTGIRGGTGEARGAVFLWHNGTDCRIERNLFLDCDTGICMGNSSARGERRHANGFLVRNNFIVRCSESNILADHTRDCRVLHNTVHDPDSRTGRLLRVVHANDGLLVAGNLFSGPRLSIEDYEGSIEVRDNLVRPIGEYFVDPAKGDLHLKAGAVDAIDQCQPDPSVTEDFDGQARDQRPDLGADEFALADPDRAG